MSATRATAVSKPLGKLPLRAPIIGLPRHLRREALGYLVCELMQTRSYSALGMREIAQAASVQAASLYWHFDSKEEAAQYALFLYRQKIKAHLSSVAKACNGGAAILGYVELHTSMLKDNNGVCLAAVLANDRHALSAQVLNEVTDFENETKQWIQYAWATGQRDLSIRCETPPVEAAQLLFSSLQGAALFSATKHDSVAEYRNAARLICKVLGVIDV